MHESPSTRPRGADLHEGEHVRLCTPLWRGVYGVVSYVGCDRVEVELIDGAILPFLATEVERADNEAERLSAITRAIGASLDAAILAGRAPTAHRDAAALAACCGDDYDLGVG
jgi:hypothetical protein